MIDNMFNDILDSNEYLEYKKIGELLDHDLEINQMLLEIKQLQKEADYLESNGDIRAKEVDEIIALKVSELNENKNYKKYLECMEKFNKKLEKK